MSKKVLFITTHRLNRAPNQRFRFEQYLSYLQSNGFEWTISNLLNENDDRIFYSKGRFLSKLWILIKAFCKRWRDIRRIKNREYDLIFISREAFFIGPPFFERLIARFGVPYVYDFDDAVWLENVSDSNRIFKRLKYFSKVGEIIQKAKLVLAGNEYLANYARQFNSQTRVVPTTIDTSYHIPKVETKEKKTITIGWTGSSTTLPYLQELDSVLCDLWLLYGNRIEIVVIGATDFKLDGCQVRALPWRKETEIIDLHQLDIGIMPLPDNEWTRGKCGLKLLQYMALGLPVVASPVGVNTDIVDHGKNGFFASTPEEWKKYLSILIEDPILRRRFGQEGRKKIEQFYSVEAWKDTYLEVFRLCTRK
ncbi:MAG: glycosyltransferase family 4 protein [Bacteroidales bacterium]|nr:glycosyltransferase family 4 protein [Bacteroidales bacterium]